MTTVQQMLVGKPDVHTISPDATIFDALGLMAARNIGALVVMDRGELVGIFSERDYARKVILFGKSSHETLVREIMTSPVITVTADRTTDDCMTLMTDKRIRHLPVVEGGRLIGVISIGDVVRTALAEREDTIRSLHSYIASGA